ncbi:MAG: DUF4157 domain-containing protein [Nitrospirota bacterium]|nr:DUF4157 domain-containing protein [Nitrospirota bacterium]
MSSRAKAGVESSGTERLNPVSQAHRSASSEAATSSVDCIMRLQRTIGNMAVRRLFKAGAVQAEGVTGQTYGGPPGLDTAIESMRGGGQPLPSSERAFFGPRFGYDFSHVRLHTTSKAAETARAVNAKAFTVGRDIAFGAGQYAPTTDTGRNLIAHELVHVVQQNHQLARRYDQPDRRISQKLPADNIARKWVVENPDVAVPAGGRTNGELLLDAFQNICGLAQLVNRGADKRLELAAGPPSPNRTEGCGCLQTIENDVANMEAGNASTLNTYPRIEVVPHGWSYTSPDPNHPKVGARHPVDPFEWGYWTGSDRRQTKEFFRTVAHEVCGHMASFVSGVQSGRGSGRGHNEAIIRENRVAAEHGVSVSGQRGLDVSEGGVIAGVHRGESFLRAGAYFDHASANTQADLNTVIQSAIDTIRYFVGIQGDRIRIQLEGFAYSNEGGNSLAQQRLDNVKQAFIQELNSQHISLTFTPPGQTAAVSRFGPDIITVHPSGSSMPDTSDVRRRVYVFLYHRAYSAAP